MTIPPLLDGEGHNQVIALGVAIGTILILLGEWLRRTA